MDHLACNECRARKLRCSKARPKCSFCTKHDTPCIYSAKANRSPLTRAYLTTLEQRSKCLEKALLELCPTIDLEAIVSGSATCTPTCDATTALRSPVFGDYCGSGQGLMKEIPELLPSTSSGFDWEEGSSKDAKSSDGMAALSVNAHGVGYLGNLAHVMLLRILRKTGWRSAAMNEVLDDPTEESQIQRIQCAIPTNPPAYAYMADQFLDAYFYHFHTAYPIIHEATFRAQHSEIIPKPSGSTWPLLSRIIQSIGAWCIDSRNANGSGHEPVISVDVTSSSDLLGSGNISAIQVLALLSLHLQRLNRPNLASVYLGSAVRMATSLGLHKEFPGWTMRPQEREIRRRVWWCLYLFDSGESITLGRPILLPSCSTMDIARPLNVPDTMLTIATAQCPNAVSGPTIYSSLITQVEFHLIFNPIYDCLISHGGMRPTKALKYDSEISNWLKSLPPYFQENSSLDFSFHWLVSARYRIFWRVRCLRMLIFTPIFLYRVGDSERQDWTDVSHDEKFCLLLCLDYAHQNISSVQRYFQYEPLSIMGDWYALYSLFQAALVSILAILANIPFLAQQYPTLISDIRIIRQVLTEVSPRNERAQKFVDVMNQLIPDLLMADEDATVPYSGFLPEHDITHTYDGFSTLQTDEWARIFWPSLS